MSEAASATDELTFTRVFAAPRELVFRCMVEPEHLAQFWGPKGMSTPLGTITVDLRPGGRFETTMVNEADGSEYTSRSVFVEIIEPEKLVWTDKGSGMTTTVTFSEIGVDRTEMHILQSAVPARFLRPEAQAGFATSLDRFATYLASLGPGDRRSGASG